MGLSYPLTVLAAVSNATSNVLQAVALRYKAERRASLLGIATGATVGLTAALMKGMTLAYQHGIVGVLTAWQTYAMITGGLAGMFLMQNALQAGRLIAAQPGITLVDPAVAILWGVLAFGEPTHTSWPSCRGHSWQWGRWYWLARRCWKKTPGPKARPGKARTRTRMPVSPPSQPRRPGERPQPLVSQPARHRPPSRSSAAGGAELLAPGGGGTDGRA